MATFLLWTHGLLWNKSNAGEGKTFSFSILFLARFCALISPASHSVQGAACRWKPLGMEPTWKKGSLAGRTGAIPGLEMRESRPPPWVDSRMKVLGLGLFSPRRHWRAEAPRGPPAVTTAVCTHAFKRVNQRQAGRQVVGQTDALPIRLCFAPPLEWDI